MPRGSAALGFAQYLPSENLLMTTQQMADMTCMALGGRAAEQVLLGKISTGARCGRARAAAPPGEACCVSALVFRRALMLSRTAHAVCVAAPGCWAAASAWTARCPHLALRRLAVCACPRDFVRRLSRKQPNASGGAAGAQNDLERVTKMAYAQVAVYGMNDKVRARACVTQLRIEQTRSG